MRAYLLSIAAVLCGSPSASRASCAIDLVGDPEVVARVHEPLVAFGDDGVACVDVRALCSRDGDDLVLDLRDQLGRSVQRRFVTPEGAAAFLISWSRRPLPQAGTGIERTAPDATAPAPTAPAAIAPAPPAPVPPAPAPTASTSAHAIERAAPRPSSSAADDLHSEVRAAFLGPWDSNGWGGFVQGALIRRRGILRYGSELRAIAAPAAQTEFLDGTTPLMWLGLDGGGTFGVMWQFGDLSARAEVAAGAAYVSIMSHTMNLHAQTIGLRGGVRAAVTSRMATSLSFEVGVGWDAMRQMGVLDEPDHRLGGERYLERAHFEIGLLWAP